MNSHISIVLIVRSYNYVKSKSHGRAMKMIFNLVKKAILFLTQEPEHQRPIFGQIRVL